MPAWATSMTQERWSAGIVPEPGERLVHPGDALGRQRAGCALQPAQRRGRRRRRRHGPTLLTIAARTDGAGWSVSAPRDPVDDLRRIAFLMERAGTRHVPGPGVPPGRRRAGRDPGRLAATRVAARHAAPAARHRREDRGGGRPVAGRRAAGLPGGPGGGAARPSTSGAAAPGWTADAGRRGAAARAARRLPHPLHLVRRRLADRGDGASPPATSATSTWC